MRDVRPPSSRPVVRQTGRRRLRRLLSRVAEVAAVVRSSSRAQGGRNVLSAAGLAVADRGQAGLQERLRPACGADREDGRELGRQEVPEGHGLDVLGWQARLPPLGVLKDEVK